MKKRRDLNHPQLYDSFYAPYQTYDKTKLWDGEKFKIEYVKEEADRLKKELHGQSYKVRLRKVLSYLWQLFFSHFAEEWILLAALGILVASISYMIDKAVFMCHSSRVQLYTELAYHPWAKYFAWISLPVTLILFSAGFTKLVSPKAVGSGLPEIKTVLRGVHVEGFLTFRTLVAKVIGIMSTLGSTMPLGKEGPLIHISMCCLHLLGKLTTFQGIYSNESRKLDMLAAAAAVGVACTFGAPIGGVLFSVELTTAYYAVRNYWRGFCTAIWGATFYRLLLVWIEGVESVTAVFKTSIFVDTPWAAQELFAFSILGIICGFGSAFYMRCRVKYGRFLKSNKTIARIRKANFFIYPGFIALVVSSINFPLGIGQFLSGHIGYGPQVTNMFSNFTWTNSNLTVAQHDMVKKWTTKWTGIYLHLVCVIAFNFVCSILAATMPIPNGSFIPNFRMGAAAGRILGELMHTWYPNGLSYWGRLTKIMPGGYSIVGAAAWTAGATQTMSVAVIVLEMTSQITHTIPILIAVLISNGIAQLLGPSLYNAAIKAKKLPYLPDLLPNNSAMYSVYVEDFMRTDIKYIYHGMSFEKLKDLLKNNKDTQSFPMVNNPVRLVLLGSIQRLQLITLIEKQVGKERRMKVLNDYEEKLCQKYASSVELFDQEFTENPLYVTPKSGEKRTVQLPKKRICDLPEALQKKWEEGQMRAPVDFSACHIDPAPFQLVERTSLLKVHTLFSMVGINVAYVTSLGKLIGVVELADLRKAIDDVNSGALEPHDLEIIVGNEEDQ